MATAVYKRFPERQGGGFKSAFIRVGVLSGWTDLLVV